MELNSQVPTLSRIRSRRSQHHLKQQQDSQKEHPHECGVGCAEGGADMEKTENRYGHAEDHVRGLFSTAVTPPILATRGLCLSLHCFRG